MFELIQERLQQKKYLLYDGAKGTFLLPYAGDKAPDFLNINKPNVVESVLKAYVQAGADIIQTNTFGATCLGLCVDSKDTVMDINRIGVEIARKAAGRNAYVAGDIGPLGKLVGIDIPPDEAIQAFLPQVAGLIEADLFHIETMHSLEEVRATLSAIRKIDRDAKPVIVTMTFKRGKRGFRTMSGVSPIELASLAQQEGLFAYGANCGSGPADAVDLARDLRNNNPDAQIVMKLNAGIPSIDNGVTRWPGTPDNMAEYARMMREEGVSIIGACCGSTPEHIRAMRDVLARR